MVESGGGMVRLGYVRRAGTSQPLSTAGGNLVVGRQSSVVSRRSSVVGGGRDQRPSTDDRRIWSSVGRRSWAGTDDQRPSTDDRRSTDDSLQRHACPLWSI